MKASITGVFSDLIYIGNNQNFGAQACAFRDRHPKYPKGVPWDQNFCLQIFVSLSFNDVILCILLIYLEENAKIWDKLAIFPGYFCNGKLSKNGQFFSYFGIFFQINQQNA